MTKYNQPKFTKIINAISEAFSQENQAGFHIVIDDGNIENRFIQWCRDNALNMGKPSNVFCVGDEFMLSSEEMELNRIIYEGLISLKEVEASKCIYYGWEKYKGMEI